MGPLKIDSLGSKRFRLVSEQKKTEERDSRFWPLSFHFSRGNACYADQARCVSDMKIVHKIRNERIQNYF